MPSLLLLDLKMPQVDGFRVLQWLRENPLLKRLPVVVLSSSGEQRDVDRAHELGANGYSVKPSAAEGYIELAAAIEQYWLRQHRYPTLPACNPPN